MLYLTARRNYYSNGRIQGNIDYDFSKDLLKITGDSFKSELAWDKMYKITELKNWFLFFESKATGHFIAKQNLSQEQIVAIRNILIETPVNKKKLLKA